MNVFFFQKNIFIYSFFFFGEESHALKKKKLLYKNVCSKKNQAGKIL
jgi:hypothetical protein